jgi:prepilin-type processing-associated H-X9-DG protein
VLSLLLVLGYVKLDAIRAGMMGSFGAQRQMMENQIALGELATNQTSEHFHFRGASRGRVTPSLFRAMVNVECHGAGANYLFVDGHAESLAWTQVQERLNQTNTVFLQP